MVIIIFKDNPSGRGGISSVFFVIFEESFQRRFSDHE